MKMKLDLSLLINEKIPYIEVEEKINFPQSDLDSVGIRRMSEVEVEGSITKDYEDNYLLDLRIKGTMVLPCSITLVDVEVPFDLRIGEILGENDEKLENYSRIVNNTIDIFPIIWQTIVVEIPSKVISPTATFEQMSGEGWRILNEDTKDEIDPRLEKLKDLIKD